MDVIYSDQEYKKSKDRKEETGMKSIEELYKEVQENEELKKEFITAFKEGKVEDFLKAHDCDATVDDVMAFLNSTKEETASEDDLAKVAGGGCSSNGCKRTDDCSYDCSPAGC